MKTATKDDFYEFKLPCPTYCTMHATTDLCRLPGRYGEYKWPRLSELADYLELDYSDLDLHDSCADVELTKRCFRQLVALGYLDL